MVASKESFNSLDLSRGPSIRMGDDSKIPAVERVSIKLDHGQFENVLYLPSLATNLLPVYQMSHTGSPKQVVFGPDSVEI